MSRRGKQFSVGDWGEWDIKSFSELLLAIFLSVDWELKTAIERQPVTAHLSIGNIQTAEDWRIIRAVHDKKHMHTPALTSPEMERDTANTEKERDTERQWGLLTECRWTNTNPALSAETLPHWPDLQIQSTRIILGTIRVNIDSIYTVIIYIRLIANSGNYVHLSIVVHYKPARDNKVLSVNYNFNSNY